MSIVIGGIFGLISGAVSGFCCPFYMNDVYPEEWVHAYGNGSALPLLTGFYGVIGGTIGGAITSYNSNKIIKDYGIVSGLVGGALGGLAAGTCGVYSNYKNSQERVLDEVRPGQTVMITPIQ
jgi:hypothetical protein